LRWYIIADYCIQSQGHPDYGGVWLEPGGDATTVATLVGSFPFGTAAPPDEDAAWISAATRTDPLTVSSARTYVRLGAQGDRIYVRLTTVSADYREAMVSYSIQTATGSRVLE